MVTTAGQQPEPFAWHLPAHSWLIYTPSPQSQVVAIQRFPFYSSASRGMVSIASTFGFICLVKLLNRE